MTLYEISAEYLTILDAAEDYPEQAIADMLEAVTAEFEDKADNVACFIKGLLSEAEAIKAEAATLTERCKRKKAQADYWTRYLKEQMQLLGKPKIETTRNLLSLRKTPPAVHFQDEQAFVEWAKSHNLDFITQKDPVPNKTVIKDYLKSGNTLVGVTLETGESLTIK